MLIVRRRFQRNDIASVHSARVCEGTRTPSASLRRRLGLVPRRWIAASIHSPAAVFWSTISRIAAVAAAVGDRRRHRRRRCCCPPPTQFGIVQCGLLGRIHGRPRRGIVHGGSIECILRLECILRPGTQPSQSLEKKCVRTPRTIHRK